MEIADTYHLHRNNDDSNNKHVAKFLAPAFSEQQSKILTAFLISICNKTET